MWPGFKPVYICIYIGLCIMCKHLNHYIYMYMWAIFSQYKPCTNIYGLHIYFFSLIWLFSSIIYPVYSILACFKGVILHHYSHQRGESPSTLHRKKGLSTKCQGRSGLTIWFRKPFTWSEVVSLYYIRMHSCNCQFLCSIIP